ncbi:hypothetical protein MMC26_007547, partial [Xylographa opegraphella]|nr:hypothetical protein [Xylographa opegraphella]
DPPSEEEHEAPLGLPVLPGLLPHASKGTPQIFAPEATVSDWLSDFIDIPTSRADLEAKAADWSSIVDQVDFELEDCHDFITLELGIRMQLPMKYELTQGIEEVYRKLNHRYGFVDLSKALAVFHDIMQFQDVDLVHGDESPQWNSWRGEYGRKIKTSASLIANAKTHLQRYNNPVSPGNTDNLISIAAVAEGVQGPDVNLHYLSQDLRTIPNSSAGEHCATQPDPKVIRPRGFGLKSAKNARKQRYKAEVEVPGSVNRTKEMANAEFVKKMKPIRYISHQRKVANFLSANAYRPVTEAQQAKQAQIKEITPWEDFEHEAPTFQDSVNPPCDQSSGAPAGPPVRGSGIVRGLVALKKSMSNISLKSSRTKNSRTVTVQSQQVAVAEDSGTGLGSGPPLATVEEENTTFRTPTPTLAPNFVERTTQLDSRVHYRTPEEHTAALKGRAGHEASGINQRYFQFAVTTPAVKKRVKSLGMQNETGSIKTSAHHGVKTGIDPQNSPLSSPLPESITVLPESNSTDHIQFRDSSILNPMQSSNSNTGNRGQDGNPSSDEDSDDTVVPVHRCRRPRPTPWPPGSNITDHIELSESTITHGRRAADKVQDKDSDDTVEPADRRLTPLLPELTFPLLNSTNNMQSPEKTILHRRRIFRPVPDDDFDDSSFFAPRPRVDVAQRNREYGLHVPGEAQVQLRPRRAPDPMTPSQEMMENVRPCQVEGQFDPEEFGLGPRRRPENVVVTQHKVKQVYIQQPHLWTPKTSEINF